MKVLFLGDVVGRAGRQVVCDQLPELRRKLGLDFVVVNGDVDLQEWGCLRAPPAP